MYTKWIKYSADLNNVSGTRGLNTGLTKILFSLFENVLVLNKTENQFSRSPRDFLTNLATKSSNEPQETLFDFCSVHFLSKTEQNLT